MDEAAAADRNQRRAAWELAAHLALTFTLTWGISAVLVGFPDQVRTLVGAATPLNRSWLFALAVWSPTLSAVVVSLSFAGLASLGALAAQALRPASILWIAIAVFGFPAAILAFGLGERVIAPGGQHFIDLHALAVGAPTLLLASFTSLAIVNDGGLGEEPGWRGFALSRLLQFMGPLPAGLALGAVWGVWHLPAFLAQGGLAGSNFGLFLVSTVAMTVFMTWIYVHANGNFLIAGVIPHLVANFMGDAHVLTHDPDLVQAGVIVAVVAIILLIYGPSLQGRRARRASGKQSG
ncbi:MAG TPA: type II CAAX endopeptidase family protein [Caulobacteraceae bacterium]|jgi:membrane protease YdiL (CAAX protease family)|nr:type II CAAX endopeptidase family protein [Caulobacteraceae bacterium]